MVMKALLTSSNSHKGKEITNTNRTQFFEVVFVSLFVLLSKLVSLAYNADENHMKSLSLSVRWSRLSDLVQRII